MIRTEVDSVAVIRVTDISVTKEMEWKFGNMGNSLAPPIDRSVETAIRLPAENKNC